MKVQKEVVEKVGGDSNYITTSGLYDVTLKAVTVDVNEKGARTIGLFVEHNGQTQMLYGALPLDLNDGSKEIKSKVATLQRLAVIAGVEDISDPEEVELPIGKAGAMKDVAVLPDFEDLDCKIFIKLAYSKGKDGKVYENRTLMNVFRADGASADEIVNETEIGVRLAKQEKYFTDIEYRDITKEEVEAWIAGGRNGTVSTGATSSAPKPSFGKKPAFGKK